MKHFLLCTLLLTAASLPAGAATPGHQFKAPQSMTKLAKARKAAAKEKKSPYRAPERLPFVTGEWAAQEIKAYYPGYDGGWIFEGTVKSTYDPQGRLVSQELETVDEDGYPEEALATQTTYSEDGFEATTLVYDVTTDPGELASKRVRAYDPQTPKLLVKSMQYLYDGGEETVSGASYYRTVDRNEKGYITGVHYFTYYMGDFEEVQRVLVGYDADFNPVSITEYQLGYTEQDELDWVATESYTDCTWYETDGQIYDLEHIFEAPNKIKSYVYSYMDGQSDEGYVQYEENDDFILLSTVNDLGPGLVGVQQWINLPNDGYQSEVYIYMDEVIPDEGESFKDALQDFSEESMLYGIVEREEFDILGNTLLAYSYYMESDFKELDTFIKGEETLDEEGHPATYVQSEFWPYYDDEDWYEEDDWYAPRRAADRLDEPFGEGEWFETEKLEFSGIVSLGQNAVQGIEATDAPAVYYSIDGRRLTTLPAHGIVIERRGDKSRKLLR